MSRLYSKLPPGLITKSTLSTVVGGVTIFFGYQILGDAETAHKMGVKLAKLGGKFPLWGSIYSEYAELEIRVWDMKFKNPLGLAAGFDKDADAVSGLKRLGFGFVEVGSVTPLPQPGNSQPRLFRLTEDAAVINRYGFNSAGHGTVMRNLEKASKNDTSGVLLGVNLGKNKNSEEPNLDFSVGVINFGPISDYLVINISSPNTPGLRSMQRRKELEQLLKSVRDTLNRIVGTKRPKILLKVSPDLTAEEKQDIAKVCLDSKFGVDGLIVTNTTTSRPDTLQSTNSKESGGLSGAPLKELSTKSIGDFYKLTEGKLPIIGCGGISTGRDAYEKIRAGASLVQLYTALVYQGFPVVGRIKRELVDCLKEDGFIKVEQAVGLDIK